MAKIEIVLKEDKKTSSIGNRVSSLEAMLKKMFTDKNSNKEVIRELRTMNRMIAKNNIGKSFAKIIKDKEEKAKMDAMEKHASSLMDALKERKKKMESKHHVIPFPA